MYVNTKQDEVSTPNFLGAYKNCGIKYEVSGLVNLWRSQSLWWTRATACQSIVCALEERCTSRTITRTMIDSRRVMMTMAAMTPQQQKQKWLQSIESSIKYKDTMTRRKRMRKGTRTRTGTKTRTKTMIDLIWRRRHRQNYETTQMTKATHDSRSNQNDHKLHWRNHESNDLVGEVNHS